MNAWTSEWTIKRATSNGGGVCTRVCRMISLVWVWPILPMHRPLRDGRRLCNGYTAESLCSCSCCSSIVSQPASPPHFCLAILVLQAQLVKLFYSNIYLYCTWSDKVLYMFFFLFFFFFYYWTSSKYTSSSTVRLLNMSNQNKSHRINFNTRNLSQKSRFNLYFCHCSSSIDRGEMKLFLWNLQSESFSAHL